MNILGFLLSKKILVVLSGLVFTGVAFASSGAASLLQNNATASETKVPEVQKVEDAQSAPSPAATAAPRAVSSTTTRVVPTTAPTAVPVLSIRPAAVVLPLVTPTPKPSASPATITGLRQSGSDDREDTEDDETEKADGSGSEISNAFQRAKDED